jgi:hypothetical protein
MAQVKMSAGAVVEGLRATTNALGRIDKEAQKAVKTETQKIANMMGREIAQAGRRTGDRRDAHVARTVRGVKDRTPVVDIGKVERMAVSRRGQGPRASDLMFGMEFGSTKFASRGGDNATIRGGRPGWRFPERTPTTPRGGNVGRWIFPTARNQQPRVVTMWADALERVMKEWPK